MNSIPNRRPPTVLLDGMNLQLPQGTGIKTYGLSLLRTLRHLECKSGILLSCGVASNPTLQELMPLDARPSQDWLSALRKRLSTFASQSSGLISPRSAHTVPWHKRIVTATPFNPLNEVDSICTIPDVYNWTGPLYKLLGIDLRFTTPTPYDIFHATVPLPLRLKSKPKVTTIHDLIPFRMPWATLDHKRTIYRITERALATSDAVVAVSECTKRDILEYYPWVKPERITVTHQTLVKDPVPATPEWVERKTAGMGLERGQFILFVGAIEPKKNLGRLLQAYASLPTNMPLVVVGKKAWLWEDELKPARDMQVSTDMSYLTQVLPPRLAAKRKRVMLFDFVSMEDLHALLSAARMLVFPSLYEGFGLPVLEAMSRGCPVITSNTSSLPEVGQDACLYVNPYKVDEIHDAMRSLLTDDGLHGRLSAAGMVAARKFSVDAYASTMQSVYDRLV